MLTLPKIKIKIMSTGTVKFFNNSKGFGFIKDNESEKEYFVHVSGLNDEVRENDEVSFDLQEGKKGLNAVNVKLV
jgi:CspA family cold shock protein